MNLSREITVVRQLCVPILMNPSYISVRYAKRKIRQSKTYELSDMAFWRKERNLEVNPNKFGPLTNLPDYSYLDGRPVPLSSNLKGRLEKQREYAETIVRLSSEIDFAKDRYQQMQKEKEESKRSIISNKLKRKGPALLKPTNLTKD